VPLYLRLTPNELTGEHTCIMIRPLKNQDSSITLPDAIKKCTYSNFYNYALDINEEEKE